MHIEFSSSIYSERVKQIAIYIETHLDEHSSIPALAHRYKIPERILKQHFLQYYGVGLFAYLRVKRIEKAQKLLLEDKSITEITIELGYDTESSFCRAFKKMMHQTPMTWKERNRIVTMSGSTKARLGT